MLGFFLQYLFDFFSSCGNSIILKIFYLMVWYEFSFVHAHRDFMASAKGFTLLPIVDRILCIGVFFCNKRIYSNDSSIPTEFLQKCHYSDVVESKEVFLLKLSFFVLKVFSVSIHCPCWIFGSSCFSL